MGKFDSYYEVMAIKTMTVKSTVLNYACHHNQTHTSFSYSSSKLCQPHYTSHFCYPTLLSCHLIITKILLQTQNKHFKKVYGLIENC